MHAPKWRTGAGVLTLLAWLASCGPNNKAVEYPLIETANTNALDIAKVELTDSATILHTDAYYRPHNWIRISSESYLQAGGKRYMLTGAEGITPDSLFWMPESGEASFTLRFEPLPSGTPSFDFIESDCEDCFKLFGIDLTGKKTFDTPDEVPEDLRQADGETAMPDPIFKTGTTTVNIHFLHYRPELGKEANLYVNTLFGTQQSYTATIDPETGKKVETEWANTICENFYDGAFPVKFRYAMSHVSFPRWGAADYTMATREEKYVASSCLWAQASNALEYPAAIILTTDAQKAVAEIDNISNYINEMTYKFITGADPLTHFDTYMDNLQKMGIENLIQLHQEAYDSFMSRGK